MLACGEMRETDGGRSEQMRGVQDDSENAAHQSLPVLRRSGLQGVSDEPLPRETRSERGRDTGGANSESGQDGRPSSVGELVTPAVTVPPAVQYPEGSIEAMICSFDWPCSEAVHVAGCESGRDLNGNLDGYAAYNLWTATADPNDGVFGLFELALPLHQGLLDGPWSDAYANSEAAHQLWADTRDWRHWAAVCRPGGY